LPEAHVEAPTAGSVILAGILLKLGSYGFLRFSLPLFPEANFYFTPLVYTISILGVIYTSLTAIRQTDFKRIIAYTSVAHMNIVMIGIYSFNVIGLEGSIIQSISHGFVSSALFLIIGVVYDRFHTRTLLYFRGLALLYPLYVSFLLFFSIANSGFPLTSGFIGEFLSLLGIFISNPFIGFVASLSIVLVPAFMLSMVHRISFGAFSKYLPVITNDLTLKEFHIFFPLAFFTVLLGLTPDLLLDSLFFPSALSLILSHSPTHTPL
jgi:NADH-quinone oxidoreductase subunit M